MGQGRDRPGQPWGMGVDRDRNQSYGHEQITVLNHGESGKIVFNTRVEPLCFEVCLIRFCKKKLFFIRILFEYLTLTFFSIWNLYRILDYEKGSILPIGYVILCHSGAKKCFHMQ